MRKLWNRAEAAVWSLSTRSREGVPNMNICTYVTAISLEPKLIMVAVYKHTQTHENIIIGETVLLQLLSTELAPVVRICGRLSGKDVDKIARLKKRYELESEGDLWYLKDAAGFMELQVEQFIPTSGDHDLLVGRVSKAKNLQDRTILTTTYLKSNGYVR